MLLKETDADVTGASQKWIEAIAPGPKAATHVIASDNSVKSAVRALEVIELFSLYRKPLSVNDICHILEIPQSSASTLLKCLNRAGFIDRDPRSRCYRPSIRSSLLGAWGQAIHFGHANLAEALDRLAERTGCSVRLAVRNRIFAQDVHVVCLGGRSEPGQPRPGILRPLCRDAVGEMLLVNLSDSEIRGIVQHSNAVASPDRAPVDIKALLERLRASRATGYAESPSLDSPHERIVAVPPPEHLGVPAVIGLSAQEESLIGQRDAILREVRLTLRSLRPSGLS